MSEEAGETAETVEKQEEVEEVVEKPAVKEKKVKRVKKRRKGVFSYYKVEGGKLTRLLPFCERCGPGFFMADHGDRYACGHCGFTRYKRVGKRE